MSRFYIITAVYLQVYVVSSFALLGAMQDTSNMQSAQKSYMLGYAYYKGAENEQDRQVALNWLTHAANLGSVQAQLFLGNYYYITVCNANRAETWYKRAADNGDAQACYAYACLARNKRDFGVAATYFKKAVLLGNLRAFSELGVLYLTGQGVGPKNYQKACELFYQGAACGDDIARANSIVFVEQKDQADNLQKLLRESKYPLVKQYCERALDKLAHKGDITACLHQAYNYAHKSTQEHNSAKAHEYLYMVKHLCDKPQELPQKLMQKTKFYATLTRLADLKSAYACSILSVLLAQKNPARAYNYQKQAFEYGSLSDGLALALNYKNSFYTHENFTVQEDNLGYYRRVLVQALEQNQVGILDKHKAQLEKSSKKHIEAQAQLILLALSGIYPDMASVDEAIAYFRLLYDNASTINRDTLLSRLLQEIEQLEKHDTKGRCACFLASIYLTPDSVYYAAQKGIEYLEKALKYRVQDALDVYIECVNSCSQVISYSPCIINHVTQLSAEDNWRAHYIMGVWSVFGHPIGRNSEQAQLLFTRVREQVPDHDGATYWLGIIQLEKIRKDAQTIEEAHVCKEQTLAFLHKAAEKKFTAALFTLGKIYQQGVFSQGQVIIAIDHARSFDYFKMLTVLNHAEGMYYLGLSYYYGRGVEKNHKKACKLFQKAYVAGINDAIEGLGLVFLDKVSCTQKLTDKQRTEILNLFEAIARQPEHSPYLQAHIYLFQIYYEGIFIKRDSIKAAHSIVQVLRNADYAKKIIASSKMQSDLNSLFDILVTQSQAGITQAHSLLAELNKLYFKPHCEQFEKDIDSANRAVRLNALIGLMVNYVHGRGVTVDLARAVSYALKILRDKPSTDLLQSLLSVTQLAEETKIPVVGVSFAKTFLIALLQLVQKLEKASWTDKNMLVLYNLLRTVSQECPLAPWL